MSASSVDKENKSWYCNLMLIDATTQTLEIKLAGAVSANELPVVLAYIDGEASNFFPTLQHSISNGATEVTILSAPEPRGKRMVKFMYIRNRDTATVVLTLQLADGATDREILKVSLLQDETLNYTDTTGFKIIDTNGNTKVGGGGGFSAPTGAINIGDTAAEGSESTHTRSDHDHSFPAPGAGYPLDVAAVEADGSASTPARSDHVHKNMDIGARVYNDAAITLTDNVTKFLTFNQERYDTDTIHSTSSNTDRLTATTAGKYLIIGNIEFVSNATGRRNLAIELNATTFIAEMEWDTNQNAITRVSICTIYDLSATDYVRLRAFQNSGGNLNVNSLGNSSPEFMMQKIG